MDWAPILGAERGSLPGLPISAGALRLLIGTPIATLPSSGSPPPSPRSSPDRSTQHEHQNQHQQPPPPYPPPPHMIAPLLASPSNSTPAPGGDGPAGARGNAGAGRVIILTDDAPPNSPTAYGARRTSTWRRSNMSPGKVVRTLL
ncbi:hypothetical protein B0H16DRAFT_1880979 [Mycena metata]|uniref:Uncharacterized protein n=1 Tax=Mycena metata TaxID=1033252 RepID=A0AAD7JUT9_9AGAR|nr:hypothetical protein B0H16DRAFT_1880979 [Mycena metata]